MSKVFLLNTNGLQIAVFICTWNLSCYIWPFSSVQLMSLYILAPRNAEEFKAHGQSETSITLEWNKVGNILNYTLVFSGGERNISAEEGNEKVTHTVLDLTAGTRYNFTLFTVFKDFRSSGYSIPAVTGKKSGMIYLINSWLITLAKTHCLP